MEQLDYNLLFRWFVGLSVDDPVWVPTVFSKNRDRLLEGDIAAGSWTRCCIFRGSRRCCRMRAFLSRRHVDPGLGADESFRRKDGNDEPPAPGRNGET